MAIEDLDRMFFRLFEHYCVVLTEHSSSWSRKGFENSAKVCNHTSAALSIYLLSFFFEVVIDHRERVLIERPV